MTNTEKAELETRKIYLTGILKPCWIQNIIDTPTYNGLINRMQTATISQVETAIKLYKGKINELHTLKNQCRKL